MMKPVPAPSVIAFMPMAGVLYEGSIASGQP